MRLISQAITAEQLRLEEERRQQALLEQQRLEQLRLEEQRRQQALLLEQQRREEEQRRQQALLAQQQAQQSSSLTGLFGTGEEHYVKFEVPGVFKEEYNIGK